MAFTVTMVRLSEPAGAEDSNGRDMDGSDESAGDERRSEAGEFSDWAANRRLFRLVAEVLHAIEAGVFHPNPG